MYKITHLISESVKRGDLTQLGLLDRRLLNTNENTAVDYILTHVKTHKEPASFEFLKTQECVKDYLIDPVYTDGLKLIFEDCTKHLVARRAMRVLTELQESFHSGKEFDLETMLSQAKFLTTISTKKKTTLHSFNREAMYSEIKPGLTFGLT